MMKFTREALRSFVDDEIKGVVFWDDKGASRLRPFKNGEEKLIKTLAYSVLETVNNAESFKREEVAETVLVCAETALWEMYPDTKLNAYKTIRKPLAELCDRLINQSIWGA